jgi:hypothetical protein
VLVNLKAQTVSLGTSNKRASSVTAPTITAVLSFLSFMKRDKRDNDKGALLMLDMQRRFLMHPANLDPVRLDKKLIKHLSAEY